MRNCFDEAFVVLKNFDVKIITDYVEEECYLVFDDDAHLTIKFSIKIKWWFKIKNALFLKCVFIAIASSLITNLKLTLSIATNLRINMKIVMLNDITVYENSSVYTRLSIVVETYLNIWNDIGEVIDVSKFDWMLINTLVEAKSKLVKVYSLRSTDRQIVNNEFD